MMTGSTTGTDTVLVLCVCSQAAAASAHKYFTESVQDKKQRVRPDERNDMADIQL